MSTRLLLRGSISFSSHQVFVHGEKELKKTVRFTVSHLFSKSLAEVCLPGFDEAFDLLVAEIHSRQDSREGKRLKVAPWYMSKVFQ
jgi:hypothetical protein